MNTDGDGVGWGGARDNPRVGSPAGGSARPYTVASVVVGGLLFVVVAASGWLSDDAYITFRTVDNLLAGRGMVWNPGWRVQVFTHPLWMLLLSGASALAGDIPRTALFLGILVSLAAVLVLVTGVYWREPWRLPLLLLLLMGSKAFVDYSTAGLENPLAHLLTAILIVSSVGRQGERDVPPGLLGLLAGGLFLTRMDLILLVAPLLMAVLWQGRRRIRRLVLFAVGTIPAAVWVLFATFYFGSPLPNTAWAKLATGIPERSLVPQGLAYLGNSLRWDPLTLTVVAIALTLAFVKRSRRATAVASGMALYLAYVVWIGGDFMSGRFLTVLFVWGAFGVASWLSPRTAVWAAGAVLVSILLNPLSPARAIVPPAGPRADAAGITDERAGYLPYTGLRALLWSGLDRDNPWRKRALEFRDSREPLRVRIAVGMFGYFSGPDKVIVDGVAVTDPLLARLPVRDSSARRWRIGHFPRNLPEGYLDSLAFNGNRIVEPHLRRWFAVERSIACGPLASGGRLRAIFRMNLGRYGHLLRAYREAGACEIPLESVLWRHLSVEELQTGIRCPERETKR